ncbi:hypothetical protein GJ496_001727 [Pomphorhynchus laevis]|nr:hypothetical protein GJ496_001727 [Pomphorhynchus laevis]
MKEASSYLRFSLIYLASPTLIICIIANLLVIVLLCRNKVTSFLILLNAMCIANLLKLTASYGLNVVKDIFGIIIDQQSELSCKIVQVLDWSGSVILSISLVLIATIRLAAFTKGKMLSYYTRNCKYCLLATLIITCGMIVLGSIEIITSFGLVNISTVQLWRNNSVGIKTHSTYLSAICTYKSHLSKCVYLGQLFLFYSIIPAFCMASFCLLIRNFLLKTINMNPCNEQIIRHFHYHNQVNKAFLTLSAIHFLCTIPYLCVWLWITLRPVDFKINSIPYVIAKSTYYVGIINHSLNVYICGITNRLIKCKLKLLFHRIGSCWSLSKSATADNRKSTVNKIVHLERPTKHIRCSNSTTFKIIDDICLHNRNAETGYSFILTASASSDY